MTYMTSKIVGIQANHPSKLNPKSDTSVFLAVEAQRLNYKIFHYDPKDLSIINDKVLAKGFFIEFNYTNKNFFKIKSKQTLDLSKCKYILIRQDPPFNLEYITTTYILDKIKNKVKLLIIQRQLEMFLKNYIQQISKIYASNYFLLETFMKFINFLKNIKK